MFHYGRWLASITDEESSNWRELANLVEFLEEEGAKGNPTDAEVFMATDNSTAENAFLEGNLALPEAQCLDPQAEGLGDEDWHDLALGSCQWEAHDHPGH